MVPMENARRTAERMFRSSDCPVIGQATAGSVAPVSRSRRRPSPMPCARRATGSRGRRAGRRGRRKKSAGPPSRMTPASASPMSSPPAPGGRGQRVDRLDPRGHQARHLPRQLVGAQRAAAEVAAGGDRHARVAGGAHRRLALLQARRGGRARRPRRRSAPCVVVAPKLSHERMTARVLTRVVPRAAISAAVAASRSKPCSIESTPPMTASRAPLRRPECAATFAPRACAASTTRGHLVRGPRRDVDVGTVHVELHEVGARVQLADCRRQQLVAGLHLDRRPHRVHAALEEPRARRAQVGPIGAPGPSVAHAERQRALAAVGRVHADRRADVAHPAHARRQADAPVVLGDGQRASRADR